MSWIIFILLSALFNALWAALSKRRLGESSSISFSFLFRSFVVLLYLPIFLLDFSMSNRPLFWTAVLFSGFLNTLIIIFLFEGVRKDYYSTYSLANASPAFTWVLAISFLKEPIDSSVVMGTALVVMGALMFYRAKQFSWLGLLCATLIGINSIFNKIGVNLSSPYTFPFLSYSFTVILLSIFSMAYEQEKKELGNIAKKWKAILPLSLLSFLAMLFGFKALYMVDVSRMAPVARIRLVFGFLLSYYYLRETLNWKYRLLGGIIISAGAALIAMA